jgi:hypothetical protein
LLFAALASTYLQRNEGVYLIVRIRRSFKVGLVGRRTGVHSFACEAELVMDLRRLNPSGPEINMMRTALLSLPSNLLSIPAKLRRSYVLESRLVFWNLLFLMLMSSVMLLVYLKQILAF